MSFRALDVRLTIHTYGHLEVEDVREGKGFRGGRAERADCAWTAKRRSRRRNARRRPLWNCGNCVPSPHCVRGISGAQA